MHQRSCSQVSNEWSLLGKLVLAHHCRAHGRRIMAPSVCFTSLENVTPAQNQFANNPNPEPETSSAASSVDTFRSLFLEGTRKPRPAAGARQPLPVPELQAVLPCDAPHELPRNMAQNNMNNLTTLIKRWVISRTVYSSPCATPARCDHDAAHFAATLRTAMAEPAARPGPGQRTDDRHPQA